jgi:hypothetical protein
MTGYLLWDWCIRTGYTESSVVQSRAFERGVHPVASVRGPENQERARESLKCPMDFILICSLFLGYFQLKSTILREVSACPQAPKQYTSAAKMSFSVLRRLKTCVSSAMKNDRLSSLGLMNIHRDFEVD